MREVCRYWQLARPDATVMDRAVLLANELVTNAVAHAPTEIRLRLELRGDRLHIACAMAARAWGVNRHPDGGKVVWCVLNL